MKTDDLKDVLALELVKTARVIAAGPLTKHPITKPYRVVMVDWGDGFSVHNQYFDTEKLADIIDLANVGTVRSFFENGDYFPTDEFHLATKRFAERLAKNAVNIESIYRQTTPA